MQTIYFNKQTFIYNIFSKCLTYNAIEFLRSNTKIVTAVNIIVLK